MVAPDASAVPLTAGGASEPAYLAGPPLFWRLMAANMVVVLGGAVVGTALTQRLVERGLFTPLTHALMVLAALGLSALLTAIILRLAFRPLRTLRAAIDAAAGTGRPAPAPAPLDPYGDPDIVAVAQAVHGLWDRLDQHMRLLEESNRQLAAQRRELADKTVQLGRLAQLALAAQEEERRRIARELHDETMQSIAALVMGLERVLQTMPAEVPHLRAAQQTMARLRDLAVRTLDELRHLAHDLRPAVLDDHGLVAAVRWLVETHEERFGLRGRLELGADLAAQDAQRGAAPRLPAPVETALFRIVQEALANAGKHAQAAQVTVRLRRDAQGVGAEIEDDGVGLPDPYLDPYPDPAGERPPLGHAEHTGAAGPLGPAAPAAPAGHMGLFNMRERAALLGGGCTFGRGTGGRGTRVRVWLPMGPGASAGADDRPFDRLRAYPFAAPGTGSPAADDGRLDVAGEDPPSTGERVAGQA
jgi:two-component system sensor histidine kinase UhpB